MELMVTKQIVTQNPSFLNIFSKIKVRLGGII